MLNAHDRFFREMWSREEIARDFLANYLPMDVKAGLRLDSLRIQKDCFVEESLREQFTDLLYSVELAEGDPGFVYMLFEHKSYADCFVALQLLRYMGAIWNRWLFSGGAKKKGDVRLPLIIPVVFYHGKEAWQPMSLFELVGCQSEALGAYVPQFAFVVSDFSGPAPADFRGDNLLRAILRLLHAVPGGNLRAELDAIMALLRDDLSDARGQQIFRAVLEYIYRAAEHVSVDEVVGAARTQLTAKEEEEAMTIAEQLLQQGMAKGMEQGMERGMAKGMEQGMERGMERGEQKTLLRILEKRFGAVPGELETRIRGAGVGQLEIWIDRALDAGELSEVFG